MGLAQSQCHHQCQRPVSAGLHYSLFKVGECTSVKLLHGQKCVVAFSKPCLHCFWMKLHHDIFLSGILIHTWLKDKKVKADFVVTVLKLKEAMARSLLRASQAQSGIGQLLAPGSSLYFSVCSCHSFYSHLYYS
jgi:hypothetical protein